MKPVFITAFLCLSEGIPLTQRLVLYTLEVGDCLFCVHASMLHRFMKIALALNSYRKRQKTAYRKRFSFRLRLIRQHMAA